MAFEENRKKSMNDAYLQEYLKKTPSGGTAPTPTPTPKAGTDIPTGLGRIEPPNIQDLGKRYGIATDMNDPLAQDQLSALNELTRQKQDAQLKGLDSAEQMMYRSIGLQQQQLENNIRDRRKQALKSGATSAQLASQELQTLLASQQGAQMYAQQYGDARMQSDQMFAGAEQQNILSVMDQLRQDKMGLSNIGVQEHVGNQSYRAQALASAENAFVLMEQYPGMSYAEAYDAIMKGETNKAAKKYK